MLGVKLAIGVLDKDILKTVDKSVAAMGIIQRVREVTLPQVTYCMEQYETEAFRIQCRCMHTKTVEFHLSGLSGTANHPDMQKIQIIFYK
jgi:hypothetical protein